MQRGRGGVRVDLPAQARYGGEHLGCGLEPVRWVFGRRLFAEFVETAVDLHEIAGVGHPLGLVQSQDVVGESARNGTWPVNISKARMPQL